MNYIQHIWQQMWFIVVRVMYRGDNQQRLTCFINIWWRTSWWLVIYLVNKDIVTSWYCFLSKMFLYCFWICFYPRTMCPSSALVVHYVMGALFDLRVAAIAPCCHSRHTRITQALVNQKTTTTGRNVAFYIEFIFCCARAKILEINHADIKIRKMLWE